VFFSLSSWELGLLIFGVIGAAAALGIALGRFLRQSDHDREPIGTLQGALLGVVGLILAFGLTLAVGRYQDRRSDVVTDANTIGTAYLRAQTIAEPQRTKSLALLAGLFALTAVLGQLISNMATALIVFPVALQAAQDLDVSPRPMLMSVAVAAGRGADHPGRDARESDGDGAGRLALLGLLEARPAAARALRAGRGWARARVLAVLTPKG
jgi:hypothetical protein